VDRKKESYIHNEEEMKNYVLENGVGKIRLLTGNGQVTALAGNRLMGFIKKILRIDAILDKFAKEGKDRDVMRIVADQSDLKDDDFRQGDKIKAVALKTLAMDADIQDYTLEIDPEHGIYRILFQVLRDGQVFPTAMDRDIFRSPKFAELRTQLSQIQLLGAPPYRLDLETGDAVDVVEVPVGATHASPLQAAARQKDNQISLPSMTALVDYVLTAGKKGLSVQRYKGLGEMNPEQLWETTMNPDKRTLLQVRVDDAVEADIIFTTLMGDQVEPRRDFIYRNALSVSNLDV
jgi:DNA gyrase subunit B